MINQSELNIILKNLPPSPGVYRYIGSGNQILYIGKAKSLKNRVSSYFQNSTAKTERMILMISQIDKIEYTVVGTEKEALILEANLIHSLQPRFNVLLKDDRSFLYVRSSRGPIPSIFLTRRKYDPNSKYFGPYTKKFAISELIRTLRIIFPFCQNRIPTPGKPCNYVAIKQCGGICCGRENIFEYMAKIEQIENILRGKKNIAIDWIQNKIKEAVSISNYELAALWRDKINLLDDTITDQKIVLKNPIDIDLITLCVKIEKDGLILGSVFVQNIRAGKIVNLNNFILNGNQDVFNTENQGEKGSGEILFSMWTRFLKSYAPERGDAVEIVLNSKILDI